MDDVADIDIRDLRCLSLSLILLLILSVCLSYFLLRWDLSIGQPAQPQTVPGSHQITLDFGKTSYKKKKKNPREIL